MNKKAYLTGRQKFFIAIFIVGIISFGLYYFNILNFKTIVKEKVNLKSIIPEKLIDKPSEEFQPINILSWCQAQLVSIGKGETEPQEVNIIGEDTINNCCVYKYKGINNCLNKTQEVDVCITSTIGGKIIYVKVDGYYKDAKNYQQIINNLDNIYNPSLFNKCEVGIY